MMKLDKRQKIILGLVIIAILILIWQLYVIFGGGTSPASVPAGTNTGKSANTVTVNTLKEVTSPTKVIQPASPPPEMTPTQQKYLSLVNEYQLVEMQRLITQDQAAIAAARAATAASLSKVGEAGGDMGNLMTNIVSDNQAGDYELIYTGQDNGEWSATLKRNGQFNDVTTGTTLPNGDKILSVSDSGVLVQEGNIKKLVSFNGVSATGEVASPPPAGADLQSQLSPPSAASSGSKSVVKPAAKPEIPPVLPSPVPAEIPMPSSAVPPVPAMPKVIVSNVKPAVPETPKIISNGFDITKANKNSYTIQVVSEGNFQAVKAFVAENRFTQAQVIKIYRNSKPWYIAVTGEYPTAAAAQKRIRQFSDKLQDEGPFVRRISDVLAERVK
jgi:hypothetical protein